MDPNTTKRGTVPGTAAHSANPSAVRRRLLLAAGAALPSVYTLTSGAQTAVASNLRCWGNPGATPPQRFTASDDSWYRSPVYTGQYKGNAAYCVTSPQSACIDSPMHPDHGADGSMWISSGNRITVGPGDNVTNVGPAPSKYGLVYVNNQGTVKTLDPNGNPNLQPLHDSCWTSMLGGRTSMLG